MKVKNLFVLAMAFAALVSTVHVKAVVAQESEESYAVGKVVSVEGDQLKVAGIGDDGAAAEWTFAVSADTELSALTAVSELQAGDPVEVYYTASGDVMNATFVGKEAVDEVAEGMVTEAAQE